MTLIDIDNDNIFELAARHKLRFTSSRGLLLTEQLWDLPLVSNDDFNLDAVARQASKDLKELSEESFVTPKASLPRQLAEVRLAIVKHVIKCRIAEREALRTSAVRRAEREKILRILAEKQDGRLASLSEEELQKQLAALE